MYQGRIGANLGILCTVLCVFLMLPMLSYSAPSADVPAVEQVPAEIQAGFSGNVKSKVFHKEGCRYFSCKECSERFTSAEDAALKGYKPCKVCIK